MADLNVMLDVMPASAEDRRDDAAHKVRLTVLSGPDFRSPHLVAGGVCEDRAAAQDVARQVREALEASPPTLRDGAVFADVPLLLPVPEGGAYERLD